MTRRLPYFRWAPWMGMGGFLLVFAHGLSFASQTVDFPALPGMTFVSIDEDSVPWKAWGQLEEDGFSFMFDRLGKTGVPPERLLVLFPGNPSKPCFLESPLREAAVSVPTVLIQPILDEGDSLICGLDDSLIRVIRAIGDEFHLPPEKVFLVGEYRTSASALTLATNHRTEIGGAIVWEGEPGAALPVNLAQTSVAVLGRRNRLGGFRLFIDECARFSVPFKMNAYWGEVEETELVDDLKEILDWMSSPEPRRVGRLIRHATYLPRYGRFGWIRIVELLSPGLPGVVEAEWTRTAMVRLTAEGIKRIRVRLDSTFDRYGRRVFFSIGELELPITLNRKLDAIEFSYSSEQGRWSARFVGFNDPFPPVGGASIGNEGFEAGETIPGFARFSRTATRVGCAWGGRFPNDFPAGEISPEDLYCRTPPTPYVRVEWNLDSIQSFHDWQSAQKDLKLEISFAPGIRSNAAEDLSQIVSCVLPFPLLERYCRDRSLPLPESLSVVDNFQHLLGLYFGRKHLASSASM